jgi:general secretion pathway protein D
MKIIAVLLITIFSQTTPQVAKKSRTVNINMNNVDIQQLIKLMSDLTGESFMLDQKVRGNITIISPKEVTVEEAFRIFESVLEVNELTLVKVGKIYKIVPAREAKEHRIRTIIGKEKVFPEDIFVTQVIPLKYIDANEMANVLRGLISKFANLQVYAPTNTLILTEKASNLDRLILIINELDREIYTPKIEVIPLKFASADEVSKLLSQLYQTAGGSIKRGRTGAQQGQPSAEISKIIPEPRTNSLIVVGTDADIEALKDLIKRLDVPIAVGTGQIHVVYLSYADATNLASTLSAIAQGGAARAAPQPGQPPSVQLEGGVRITADKSTNSLIIIATPSDFETLKSVIAKLDIPRKQVFVEALIMEVSLSKMRELGLSFHAGYQTKEGTATFIGGESVGGIPTLVLDPTAFANLTGLFAGVIGETITITTEKGVSITIPSFAAFLRALQRDTEVNVLSTPQLLTLDNEEAQITVAQNVPFPTGQAVGAGGVTTQTIQRQDVGITLKITPQVNPGSDEVKLKIYTEVSDVASGPEGLNVNVLGITTFKRSAQTVVTVRDKNTVVIGGLIRDSITDSEVKVPFLGDIPVIGWLFRSKSKRVEKTNLLLFITPYIISTSEDLTAIKEKKIEEGLEFRKRYTGETKEYEKKTKEMKKIPAPEVQPSYPSVETSPVTPPPVESYPLPETHPSYPEVETPQIIPEFPSPETIPSFPSEETEPSFPPSITE